MSNTGYIRTALVLATLAATALGAACAGARSEAHVVRFVYDGTMPHNVEFVRNGMPAGTELGDRMCRYPVSALISRAS